MYIERLDINCRPKKGKKKSKIMAFLTNDKFPLLPVLRIRDADKANSIDISLKWLCFFARDLSSPSLSVELSFSSYSFEIVASILYVRFGIWIPFSNKFQVRMLRFNRDVIQQRKNGIK